MTTYIGAGGTKKVDDKIVRYGLGEVTRQCIHLYSVILFISLVKRRCYLQVITEEDRGTDPTDGSERGYISAKHDKGFTVVDGTGTSQVNGSGEDYVAWCLRDGGNKNTFNVDGVGYATTTAAGLTAGSMNPTGASVGTKQVSLDIL